MISLRRMMVLSVVFHGVLFLTLILSSLIWSIRPIVPVIHSVELVNLPQERIEPPKVLPEKEPKPVAQKPEIEKKEALKITKKPKALKPIEEKKPLKKETAAVTEKPPMAQETPKTEPAPQKEVTASLPNIPDVMPILQKPYTEFEFYHAQIARVIRSRWAPPPTMLSRQEMKAIVSFKLSRSGRIESAVALEESSGNLFYDQAALRATMGPLPPPPPGYPEELLKMRLIYVLDQSLMN